MEVRLDDITKRFGRNTVVNGVSLDIRSGEMMFLLGPSGCGKTTVLRVVAGFLEPEGGRVTFGGRVMNGVAPQKRNTALVFQNYAVWPHMSLFENVAFGLRARKVPAAELRRRVGEAIEMVRLDGFERRRPGQLSGGQQQRVALARAIVVNPDLLLFDEPLSNLDARLRVEMRAEIRRLHGERGITSLYVTHDQEEALTLADRIAVMREGRIEQVGAPREIYDRPTNAFVASFMGEINLVASGSALAEALGVAPGRRCGFRPERVRIGGDGIRARVRSAMFLGSRFAVELDAGGMTFTAWSEEAVAPGAEVRFSVAREHVMEFEAEDGR